MKLVRGRSRVVILAGLFLLALAGTLALDAVRSAASARRLATVAAAHLERAEADARNGDLEAASAELRAAAATFAEAARLLDRPGVRLGQLAPGFGDDIAVARTLATAGRKVAVAAQPILAADPGALFTDGRVDLEALHTLAADARRLEDVGRTALAELDVPDRDLVAPVRRAAMRGREAFALIAERAGGVADGTELAAALAGDGKPKRWLVVVQNLAEQRATGGIFGSWGVLTSDAGRVELGPLRHGGELRATGAPDPYAGTFPGDTFARFDGGTTWQNTNMLPDFPTVARQQLAAYADPEGGTFDGVIAIDPMVLGELIRLTGPVDVAGYPEPITAERAVEATLSDAYAAFDKTDRLDFLADLVDAVWQQLTTGGVEVGERNLSGLGGVIAGRHLMVYASDPALQDDVAALGLDGRWEPGPGDALGVVTQNAAGNKLDFYLDRTVRYDATVAPAGDGELAVQSRVAITLTNTAPAYGLPDYVIGLEVPGPYATNRTWLSVYTPLSLESATVSGAPATMESARHGDWNVYSLFVVLPPGVTELDLRLAGTVPALQGAYRLDLLSQPLRAPQATHVAVTRAAIESKNSEEVLKLEGRRTIVLPIPVPGSD